MMTDELVFYNYTFPEYLEAIIEYTEPYYMFPALFTELMNQMRTPLRIKSETIRPDEYYLRRFPVWFVFRGNNSLFCPMPKLCPQ